MSVQSEEHTKTVSNKKEGAIEYQPAAVRINEVAQKFLGELEEERQRLGETFPHCAMLIDEAFERVYATGRVPGKELFADVYKQKPIKITQKVFVPVKQYPKFNFTGKILGPKGNSLRRLQEETQCKILIKGRSSMRNRAKEEELRASGDPQFAHLNKDLFIEISAVSAPAECYARVAYALAEIRKYLVPDKNDEVSHEQLRELMEIDPQSAKNFTGPLASVFDKKFLGSSSSAKYLSLINRSKEHHEDEDGYEHDERIPKRSLPYEYMKESSAVYKRPMPPSHAVDVKRFRETPVKSHKPSVLNKYK